MEPTGKRLLSTHQVPGSLHEFLEVIEGAGELHRVQAEVDPELEITEIATRLIKRKGPALLFERVKGSPYPLAINVFASQRRIELALAKISSAEKGWRMIPAKKGKPSVTAWRVVATHEGRALVEFRPATGRTHQIRVHAASGIGIALVGDPVYGTKQGAPRTMLHASALTVEREGKTDIAATSPLPADFQALGFGGEGPDAP